MGRRTKPVGRRKAAEPPRTALSAHVQPVLRSTAAAGPAARQAEVTEWFARGTALHGAGMLEEAVRQYRKVVDAEPTLAPAQVNLAIALRDLGRAGEAAGHFEVALRLRPDSPQALKAYGDLLVAEGETERARTLYERALAVSPGYAGARRGLGRVLLASGRAAEAAAVFEQALELEPAHAHLHNDHGVALQRAGRLPEALDAFLAALAHDAENVEALANAATALKELERLDEAAPLFEAALRLRPDSAEIHYNRADLLQRQGRIDEALAAYDHVLELEPGHARARWNRGLVRLLDGDYAGGWADYEARFDNPDVAVERPALPGPAWDGASSLDGATVLLNGEQGHGDTVQFVRYADALKRRGAARVVVTCERPLVRLLERCRGVDEVVPRGEPLPSFDVHASVMSLPHLLGTRLESVPADVPYLEPPEQPAPAELAEAGDGVLRVGLVWAGSPHQANDRNRSLPLAALEPLLDLEGVRFFSLQKGPPQEQLAPYADRIVDLGSGFEDFADTARAIAGLDLVIGVCTSVTHLAGALAAETWVLLAHAADWRWLRGRADSPWYPTARLFRQSRPREWGEVVAAVRAELEQRRGLARAARPAVELRSPAARFRTAVELHGSGLAAQAIPIYVELVTTSPELAEAHANLGAALLETGQPEAAAASLRRALQLRPDRPEWHGHLGLALQRLGEGDAAVAAFERVVALDPDSAAGHANLGATLQALGRSHAAAAALRRALELNPADSGTLANLGGALLSLGHAEKALPVLRRALELSPDAADVHNKLGLALHALDDAAGAGACFERAFALAPDFAEACNNLGCARKAEEDVDGALAAFGRALELDPGYPEAWRNLGLLLREQRRHADALDVHTGWLEMYPDSADAWNGMGLTLQALGRANQALACFARAATLRPDWAEPVCNAGIVQAEQLEMDAAIAHYDRALELDPALHTARWNRALARLVAGDFERGWRDYEARWLQPGLRGTRPDLPHPEWQGEPLDGRTLLLYTEQGLGDSIQFVRCAAELKRYGAGAVVLTCEPALVRLFARCDGLDAVVPKGEPLPDFDLQAPLLSLPRLLELGPANLPGEVPYLRPPAGPAPAALVRRVPGRRRVGLVWAGSPQHADDDRRSIPLALLEPLVTLDDIDFFSLQKGPGLEQLTGRAGECITELGSGFTDLADTARAIAELDLVIAVDTSVAHLAGALGVPTWILLAHSPDWRWLLHREDSPWYPSARLFRQPRPGDWRAVVRAVRAALVARPAADESLSTAR